MMTKNFVKISMGIVAIALLSFSLVSCCDAPKTADGDGCCDKSEKTECTDQKPSKEDFTALIDVINTPENYIGQTVYIRGEVLHVCAHKGDKLFLSPAGDTTNYIVCMQKEGAETLAPIALEGKMACVKGEMKKIVREGDVEVHHGKKVVYYIENEWIKCCDHSENGDCKDADGTDCKTKCAEQKEADCKSKCKEAGTESADCKEACSDEAKKECEKACDEKK